ncbi:MAG: hypothetical protein JXR84_01980 [Anaerolineae bacterium]|nr:hypothetical protein [Anaerolineae bacterium]
MKKFEFVFGLAITTVLLVACSRPTADSGGRPTISPLPTAPVSPISPLPAPPLESEAAGDELSALRVQVAEQAGLPAAALTLVSAEEVTWPDTSLGCPQPGMVYAQVLTPGWRMVFADAEGREYNIHTTENYQRFVICELPAESAVPPAYRDNPAVEAAIKALVEQKGVARESVIVVDVIAVEWRDSCLGCKTPGQRCLMVVTPGYRITLQSGAEIYELHTDRTGRQAIICTLPSLTPPRSDS